MILFVVFLAIFVVTLAYQFILEVYLQILWNHVKVPLGYAALGTVIFTVVVGFVGMLDVVHTHIILKGN